MAACDFIYCIILYIGASNKMAAPMMSSYSFQDTFQFPLKNYCGIFHSTAIVLDSAHFAWGKQQRPVTD